MEKFRFAPIIRVSTESQKEKGESLNVQTELIKKQSMFAGKIVADVRKDPELLLNKSYNLKRKFIEHCFNGKDAEGNTLGAYITLLEGGNYQVEVKGFLDSALIGLDKIHENSEPKHNLIASKHLKSL